MRRRRCAAKRKLQPASNGESRDVPPVAKKRAVGCRGGSGVYEPAFKVEMVATHAQTDAAAESEDSGTDGYFTAEEGYPTADSDTEELQEESVDVIDETPNNPTPVKSKHERPAPTRVVKKVTPAQAVRRSGRRRVSTWKAALGSSEESAKPSCSSSSGKSSGGVKRKKRQIRITPEIKQSLEEYYAANPTAKVNRKEISQALDRSFDDMLWNCIRVYAVRKFRPLAKVRLGSDRKQVLALMLCFGTKGSPCFAPLSDANLARFLEEKGNLFPGIRANKQAFEALRICWKEHEPNAHKLSMEARAKRFIRIEFDNPNYMGMYLGRKYNRLQVDAILRHFGTRRSGSLVPRTNQNIEAFLAANPKLFRPFGRDTSSCKTIRYLWQKYEATHSLRKT